jgi:hypothetical protein
MKTLFATAFLSLLALTCATPLKQGVGSLPYVQRLDSRLFQVVEMDTVALRSVYGAFRAAYPSEASVCLDGVWRDTVINNMRARTVHVLTAHVANILDADSFDVHAAPPSYLFCTKNDIGMAHDHPYNMVFKQPCEHSDPDVRTLLASPQLFSVIFCQDGMGEVLWQDFRRFRFRWYQ